MVACAVSGDRQGMTAPNEDGPGHASASMPRPGDEPDDASPHEAPDVPAAQEQPPSFGYGSAAAGTDRSDIDGGRSGGGPGGGEEIEDEGGGSTGGG